MNSDVDQMHIVDKKSCALKSWARTMGDQIGAEMRLGAPPLVSGVHDELVVAALRGKGQTERGVWRTTYNGHHNAFRWWTSICSHWGGKVSWISCPSSGDLELEEVTIRVWRVSRRCQKTWREPPLPQGADIQAHAHHLKDRYKRVRVDLTFQLPLFFAIFCQKQGNECLVC